MAERILVVDDDPTNRRVVMAMLRREGWVADEAADGVAALARLSAQPAYQAVLLDISMPGMSGLEVCRRLRANPSTANLPLIAYTAHALEEEKDRFFAAGFDALLIKPVGLDSLRDAIKQALEPGS